MRQWPKKDYCRMLERNVYHYDREGKGSHSIYTNHEGIHITVSKDINPCVARRIIKEHNLNVVFLIYSYEFRCIYQV